MTEERRPVIESRTLTINGEPKTVSVPDDMPLLWVLHNTKLWRRSDAVRCGECQP